MILVGGAVFEGGYRQFLKPKTMLALFFGRARAVLGRTAGIRSQLCQLLKNGEVPQHYRGTSPITNTPFLGPYSRFFERPDLNYGHLKKIKEPEILIFSLRRKF
jgi:hypothetical protein